MNITVKKKNAVVKSQYLLDNKNLSTIIASLSTKEIVKNMKRVKSSNIYSQTINVHDPENKVGDVYIRFHKNGVPTWTYVYYDVPIKLYRKWLAAPSKGSFFWHNMRHNFYYTKLDGDKYGKLKNSINHYQPRNFDKYKKDY